MKDQVKPTTEDVLADILKLEKNQADIDALIECRTAYGLAESILHRGLDIANDLDLVSVMLVKLGQLKAAKEVSDFAWAARNAAQFCFPAVCSKVKDAIDKKVARLHPESPSSKARVQAPTK
jgi:hypothetical protein